MHWGPSIRYASEQGAKEYDYNNTNIWKYYTLEKFHSPYDGWEPREWRQELQRWTHPSRQFFSKLLGITEVSLALCKASGTAGSQALDNRIMKALDMFWFFLKINYKKIVKIKPVACRRLHQEQSAWDFRTLGLVILKYCFWFSFPKAVYSLMQLISLFI